MVNFNGKWFNHESSKGEVPNTLYGMSKMYITQLAPPLPKFWIRPWYPFISACINRVDGKTPGSDSFRDGKAESPGNYGTETPINSMVDWNPALGSNDVTPPSNSSPVSGVSPHTPSGFPVSGVTPLPNSSSVSASTSLANTRQVFSAIMEFFTLPLA